MTNADFHKKILETIWDIIEEAQDEVEDTGGLMTDEGCPAGPLTEEQEGFVQQIADELSDIRTEIAGAIDEAETAEKKEATAVPEKNQECKSREQAEARRIPVHISMNAGSFETLDFELKHLEAIQKEHSQVDCTLSVNMCH